MQVLEGDVGQQWRIEVDGAAGGVFKTEGGADDPGGNHAVERIALETCHRINRATPVTVTAVVCPALLAADRSLTWTRCSAPSRRWLNWPTLPLCPTRSISPPIPDV